MPPALETRDHSRVEDVIRAALRAPSVDEFVDGVLDGLLDLIPSVDVSWNEINGLEQTARVVVKPDPVGYEHLIARFADYADEHPVVQHVQGTGDTRTHILSDFIDPEEFRKTALYRDIFTFLGIETQMVLALPAPAGVAIGFACNRDETGFSQRDRLVMDTLRPYLVHGYRAAQLREGSDLIQNALSATGWSVALVHDDGNIAEITEGTAEILRGVGVDMDRGRMIPETLQPTFVSKTNGYRPSQPATPSRPVPLSDVANGAAGSVVPSPAGPHVVLVRASNAGDTSRLMAAGLTPRQIDVAVALAEGGTNHQISRRLGLAEGTVKKHLEAVYRTLDVDNRASAVAVVRSLTS